MAITVAATPAPTQAIGLRSADNITSETFSAAASENDLIVLVLALHDGANAISATSGWTEPSGFTLAHSVVSTKGSGGDIRKIEVWWKKAGPSEGTSYQFTGWSTSTPDYQKKMLTALVLTGETDWQVDGTADAEDTGGTAASATQDIPSCDPTESDAGLIACLASGTGGSVGDNVSGMSIHTKQTDFGIGGGGEDATNAVGFIQVTDGSAKTGTFTVISTTQEDLMIHVGFSAPPAGAATPKGPLGMPLRGPFGGPI